MGYSLAAVNQWNLIALALYFYMLFLFILNNGILYAYYVDLCRSMQNICNIGSLTGVFSIEYVPTVDGQQFSYITIFTTGIHPMMKFFRGTVFLQTDLAATFCFSLKVQKLQVFFAPRSSAAPNIARYWNSERPRQPKKALLRPQAWRSAVGHVRSVGELKLLHLHWCHQTWEWKINEFKWKSQV